MKVKIDSPGRGAELNYSNWSKSRFFDWYCCEVYDDSGTQVFQTFIEVEPQNGPRPTEAAVLARFRGFAKQVAAAALPLWE